MDATTTKDEMLRPALMVRAARIAARHYQRRRDLPAAVPGLMTEAERALIGRLAREEAVLEARRRSGAAGYRPARHLQVLAAFLAECREAGIRPAEAAAGAGEGAQANASRSASFRRSTKSRKPSSMPGSMAGRW